LLVEQVVPSNSYYPAPAWYSIFDRKIGKPEALIHLKRLERWVALKLSRLPHVCDVPF